MHILQQNTKLFDCTKKDFKIFNGFDNNGFDTDLKIMSYFHRKFNNMNTCNVMA